MHISITFDRTRICRWHLWLIDTLSSLPETRLSADLERGGDTLPTSLRLLLALERLTVRGRNSGAAETIRPADLPPCLNANGDPDIVINLTGGPISVPHGRPVLQPLYDGIADEHALWSALLERRAPLLTIAARHTQPIARSALAALEQPGSLIRGSDAVFARLVQLIASSVRNLSGPDAGSSCTSATPAPPTHGTATGFVAGGLETKARSALAKLLRTAPQWAVVWRAGCDAAMDFDRPLDPHAFTLMPDDRQRYYADPFPFSAFGRTYVFVEEFPYATGQGIISVSERAPDGTLSPPRPVLETTHHLSYPQVFARDGQIWMLPEAAASGRLTLYRATRFPDRWEPHTVVIDRPLHDATLFEHAGNIWITASEAFGKSSSWDALSLFSADRLLGPWTACAENPVLIDAASARPAGVPYERDGQLWRPAQDCRGGYGFALTLARVTKLDAGGFAQEARSTLRFAPESGIKGPHTLNMAAGLETLDAFAPRARLRDWFS